MNHIQTCQNKNAERKILKTKGKPLMMYKKTPLRLIVDIRNSGSLKAVRYRQSAERKKTQLRNLISSKTHRKEGKMRTFSNFNNSVLGNTRNAKGSYSS